MLVFSAFLACPFSLRAQDSQMNFPKGNATWKVDISYPDERGHRGDIVRPVRIDVTRSGDVACYQVTWSDRAVTRDWVTRDYVFVQDRTTGRTVLQDRARGGFTYRFLDESAFGWIKPQNLVVETLKYRETECRHFRSSISLPALAGASPEVLECQAWIEKETGVPVAFEDGNALYTYSFGKSAAAALLLPEACRGEQAAFERALQAPKRLGR
ncbi:MAG: hypothetical protein BGO12_22075 [Verrucomicrobia bacterium 61-8]|nr:MAG: hypothetical protein BGO12_22075 [Verrucomicrobia bacterium 61-8]